MRYFFAILSLVIAAVLLVLGVGQRTFLGGPSSIQRSIDPATISGDFAVLNADIFSEIDGKPSVILTGDSVFLAVGHQRDIQGWVAPEEHSILSLDATGESLTATTVQPVDPVESPEDDAGEDPPVEHPRGSDLWLSEYSGDSTLKVAMELNPDQGVLVAASATPDQNLTPEIKISWAQERNTPLAGPLLVTGGLFAALGALLYLFAIDHDRRGLGPRRGRKGPFQGLRNTRVSKRQREGIEGPNGEKPRKRTGLRRTLSITGLSLAGTLVLAGCSPSYWPQSPEPSPTTDTSEQTEEASAPVPVTESQVSMIVERISRVANEADNELDADLLAERFTGPAFDQRSANYAIRKSESSYQAPPRITSEMLGYALIQSTESWPRTMFVTVESSSEDPHEIIEEPATESAEENPAEESDTTDETAEAEPEATPTLALLMTQASPRENFQVTNVISLRGGIEMPAAAPISEGTALLADDLKTLRLEPRLVGEAFAQVLEEGPESERAADFTLEGEILVERMGLAWAQEQSGENVNYSVSVAASETPAVTLSTGQGGALVIASVLDDHITTADGDRYRVELSKIEQALGLSGSQTRVVQQWQHAVLFYVPSAESGNLIQVLGSSSEIVRATSG